MGSFHRLQRGVNHLQDPININLFSNQVTTAKAIRSSKTDTVISITIEDSREFKGVAGQEIDAITEIRTKVETAIADTKDTHSKTIEEGLTTVEIDMGRAGINQKKRLIR